MFEAVDDPGSDKRRTQVDRQPRPARFYRLADRGEDIFFIAQTAHPPQIVVGLFIDHIDDLIDSQTADQLTIGIDNGGAEQVITFEGARHLLRLFVRLKGDRIALHHLPTRFCASLSRMVCSSSSPSSSLLRVVTNSLSVFSGILPRRRK